MTGHIRRAWGKGLSERGGVVLGGVLPRYYWDDGERLDHEAGGFEMRTWGRTGPGTYSCGESPVDVNM